MCNPTFFVVNLLVILIRFVATLLQEEEDMVLGGHSMDPVKMLAFARTLGARPIRALLVGQAALDNI